MRISTLATVTIVAFTICYWIFDGPMAGYLTSVVNLSFIYFYRNFFKRGLKIVQESSAEFPAYVSIGLLVSTLWVVPAVSLFLLLDEITLQRHNPHSLLVLFLIGWLVVGWALAFVVMEETQMKVSPRRLFAMSYIRLFRFLLLRHAFKYTPMNCLRLFFYVGPKMMIESAENMLIKSKAFFQQTIKFSRH